MPPKRKGPPVEDASQQAFDHVVAGKTIKEAMDLTGLPDWVTCRERKCPSQACAKETQGIHFGYTCQEEEETS